MTATDFTTSIVVDHTPQQAFDAINNVRGWWSEEIEGKTDELYSTFFYQYEDIHRAEIKVIELLPGKKVVWEVVKNYFSFTKDESEWTGTLVVFDISTEGKQTKIRMTHVGLVPACECFDACNDGWTNYIQNSLRKLITTGKGEPNGRGKARTKTEKKLSTR